MIRYSYNEQTTPPAPFIYINVKHPHNETIVENIPAQIDTAAGRTVLPEHIVTQLGLEPVRAIPVAGFGGQIQTINTYIAEVEPQSLKSVMVEVLAHAGEPFILLGRDVLNHFRIVLDGPKLRLEMS